MVTLLNVNFSNVKVFLTGRLVYYNAALGKSQCIACGMLFYCVLWHGLGHITELSYRERRGAVMIAMEITEAQSAQEQGRVGYGARGECTFILSSACLKFMKVN